MLVNLGIWGKSTPKWMDKIGVSKLHDNEIFVKKDSTEIETWGV